MAKKKKPLLCKKCEQILLKAYYVPMSVCCPKCKVWTKGDDL